jgi:hypothetical protein
LWKKRIFLPKCAKGGEEWRRYWESTRRYTTLWRNQIRQFILSSKIHSPPSNTKKTRIYLCVFSVFSVFSVCVCVYIYICVCVGYVLSHHFALTLVLPFSIFRLPFHLFMKSHQLSLKWISSNLFKHKSNVSKRISYVSNLRNKILSHRSWLILRKQHTLYNSWIFSLKASINWDNICQNERNYVLIRLQIFLRFLSIRYHNTKHSTLNTIHSHKKLVLVLFYL